MRVEGWRHHFLCGFYQENILVLRAAAEAAGLTYVGVKEREQWRSIKYEMMKRILLVLALAVLVVPAYGQKLVKFSSLDEFPKEFTTPIKLPRRIRFFMDSLPTMQLIIDDQSEKDFINLCNNMLRKRIFDIPSWDKLFQMSIFIYSNEEEAAGK